MSRGPRAILGHCEFVPGRRPGEGRRPAGMQTTFRGAAPGLRGSPSYPSPVPRLKCCPPSLSADKTRLKNQTQQKPKAKPTKKPTEQKNTQPHRSAADCLQDPTGRLARWNTPGRAGPTSGHRGWRSLLILRHPLEDKHGPQPSPRTEGGLAAALGDARQRTKYRCGDLQSPITSLQHRRASLGARTHRNRWPKRAFLLPLLRFGDGCVWGVFWMGRWVFCLVGWGVFHLGCSTLLSPISRADRPPPAPLPPTPGERGSGPGPPPTAPVAGRGCSLRGPLPGSGRQNQAPAPNCRRRNKQTSKNQAKKSTFPKLSAKN